MKNYSDQGDCYPPKERGIAIDGWSIAYAALFPSKKTKQLTSFLIKLIYHQIDGVLLSSSNLVNAGWLWQLSQGNGVNQKQRSILKE